MLLLLLLIEESFRLREDLLLLLFLLLSVLLLLLLLLSLLLLLLSILEGRWKADSLRCNFLVGVRWKWGIVDTLLPTLMEEAGYSYTSHVPSDPNVL